MLQSRLIRKICKANDFMSTFLLPYITPSDNSHFELSQVHHFTIYFIYNCAREHNIVGQGPT